jgi:hypothetical protein
LANRLAAKRILLSELQRALALQHLLSSNALQDLVRRPELKGLQMWQFVVGYLYELDACLRRKINVERDHEQGNKH